MDHLPKHLRREWRRIAAEISAKRDPRDVADLIATTSAKVLRRSDIRWITVLADGLDASWRTGAGSHVEDASDQIGPMARTGLGMCFVDAARVLSAQGVSPLGDVPDALEALTRAGLTRMPERFCFSYEEPSLAGGAFPTRQDYRAYIREIEALVRVEGMAAAIIRDGHSGRVRAPNRRRQRAKTSRLINRPVDTL